MLTLDTFTDDRGVPYLLGMLTGYALVFVLPYIFYILQVQRVLRLISPDLRKAEPETAWLLLIPVFRLVWSFILVTRIGDSLRAEQQRRGILEFDERPGFALGMAMASASVLYRLISLSGAQAVTGVFLLALLACWIVYWVKLAGFEKQLKQSGHWQQYAAAANPYYQQAWPGPQWNPQQGTTQHDWQRQGMGQQWQHPHYPPAPPQQPGWSQPPPGGNPWPPPALPNWNAPPTQPANPWPPPAQNTPPPPANPWQPPAQNTPPPTPPPTDPNDLSRWMPPGS
jgi:hypothetical protein